jgi:hypothetical protein
MKGGPVLTGEWGQFLGPKYVWLIVLFGIVIYVFS